jgi:hypothetical protein
MILYAFESSPGVFVHLAAAAGEQVSVVVDVRGIVLEARHCLAFGSYHADFLGTVVAFGMAGHLEGFQRKLPVA